MDGKGYDAFRFDDEVEWFKAGVLVMDEIPICSVLGAQHALNHSADPVHYEGHFSKFGERVDFGMVEQLMILKVDRNSRRSGEEGYCFGTGYTLQPKIKPRIFSMISTRTTLVFIASLLAFAISTLRSLAYERYKNDAEDPISNCALCHGDFTGGISPKGTVFPSGDKHEMHRSSASMDTECNLCHTTGDSRNPYTGSSNGTSNNAGLGCSGCHNGPGLRAHHAANGIMTCYTVNCHDPEPRPPENVPPPYYGTDDTRADNPCNDVRSSNMNENWSIADFLGLDNDGNNVYDKLDPTCSPYRIVAVTVEGDDIRITWETVGGRTDVVEVSSDVEGPYSNVGSPMMVPGSDVVTMNRVEVGGATNTPLRFYRVELIP